METSSCELNKRHFVCTLCPNGCDLEVTQSAEGQISVQGAKCDKGVGYGTKEVADPERVLTTTVRVLGGTKPIVAVRSSAPMKKAELRETVALLAQRRFQAPVTFGQVLASGLGKNEVDILATAAVEKR